MISYILSIVGIVFLGVLVDIILPDGEMNKYVKGVFSIIAMCVIISPIPKLIKTDFDIGELFYDSTATQIDNDFLEATNKQIKNQYEITLQTKLADAGFAETKVEILYEMSNYNFVIKKVIIDISNMVINANIPHINKYTEIKQVTVNYLNVEESDIVINEWRKENFKRKIWLAEQFKLYKKTQTSKTYWAYYYNYFCVASSLNLVWKF